MPSDHHASDLVTKPLEELLTLAHEDGHYLSSKKGNRTPEYLEAVNALRSENGGVLRSEQRSRIVAEEERAWSNAKAVLKRLGFAQWRRYNARRKQSIAMYTLKLGARATSR